MSWLIRALSCAVAFCLAVPASAQDGPIVRAPAGAARGEADSGVHVFRGLPYAQAPVGRLRWRPPEALRPWQGTRDATRFGPPCHQPRSRPGSIYYEPLPEMSEDCLSLNIWAPAPVVSAPPWIQTKTGAPRASAGAQTLSERQSSLISGSGS